MINKNIRVSTCIIIIGALILILSVSGFLFEQMKISNEMQKTVQVIPVLEDLIPQRTAGILENHSNNTMPSIEIQGRNYIGLLELPGRNVKLPVCSEWNIQTVKYVPCLYKGSAYDGSLIIGGTDTTGQFDFMDEIDVDEEVKLTDVTGKVFSYKVISVKHSESAKTEVLESDECDLTLFVRAAWTSNYIIVRCSMN